MVAFRKNAGKALRPIIREPRSTDALMEQQRLMVHNRVGTMLAPNVAVPHIGPNATSGMPVAGSLNLAGGIIEPLSNRAVRPADQPA